VKSIELVWLKVSMEVCKQRVSVRTDHPTIAPGEQGTLLLPLNSHKTRHTQRHDTHTATHAHWG